MGVGMFRFIISLVICISHGLLLILFWFSYIYLWLFNSMNESMYMSLLSCSILRAHILSCAGHVEYTYWVVQVNVYLYMYSSPWRPGSLTIKGNNKIASWKCHSAWSYEFTELTDSCFNVSNAHTIMSSKIIGYMSLLIRPNYSLQWRIKLIYFRSVFFVFTKYCQWWSLN